MRGRGERLEQQLAERELDRMLVTDLTNVRYLTGFTGTNGACICGPGVRLFLTDFRYTERAAAEVEGWETVTITNDWLKGIAERLSGRVGFEDDHMSVRLLGKLKEKLADGIEMAAAGGRSSACAGSRTRRSWRRSPRPRSWPTRSGPGRWNAVSLGAASARSPAPPKPASASSVAILRSQRSSPPVPTALCLTPSPVSAR
jgi:hypothetical protein